ncbi:MAG: PAS domain S-box protein [Candidatus Omnitrophica bacterium]|nr:PAS domain S-box protein [Candidatus Omnitrophota bacterium]
MSEQNSASEKLSQEIKQLKRKLAESEQTVLDQFARAEENKTVSSILNAVPHAVIGLVNQKIVFANKAVKTIFNIDRETIIGQSTRRFYRSDEDFQRIADMIYPVLDGKKCYAQEFPCRTYDGRDIICNVSAARFGETLQDKRIVVMYEDCEDIALRRQIEKDLLLLSNLMEQSRDAILFISLESAKLIYANKEACESLGYDKAELLSKTVLDIAPLFTPERWAKHIQLIKESALTMLQNTIHRRKDGSQFPVEVSTKFVRFEQNNYLISIVRDISDKSKEQAKLEGINSLKDNLLAPGELTDKMKLVTDAAVKIFDADFARIWMIKPGDLCDKDCIHANNQDDQPICRYRDKCLHLIAGSGSYTDINKAVRMPFDCYKIGKIASGEDRKFITNDIANEPSIQEHPGAKEKGLVSFAGYRIVSQAQTIGVFALFSRHVITPNMDAMLENMVNVTGLSLQTAVMEKELFKNNQFLKNIIESLTYPFLVINAEDYSIVLANSHAFIAKDQSLKTCYEITHKRSNPCDGADNVCPMAQVKKIKKAVIVEHLHYDQQGNQRFVEVHCDPIFDDAGNIKQVIEYALDMTERKKTESELKLLVADWHRTFDSIDDLIFIQDTNNVIVRVNKACANYLKMEPNQIEGRKCYELWHKQDSPWQGCPMEFTTKDQQIHIAEIEDVSIGIPFRIKTSPIFGVNGQMAGAVHIAQDISKERQSIKELNRKMRDLEIFQKSAVGRELKMMEMKKKIQDLEKQIQELEK